MERGKYCCVSEPTLTDWEGNRKRRIGAVEKTEEGMWYVALAFLNYCVDTEKDRLTHTHTHTHTHRRYREFY